MDEGKKMTNTSVSEAKKSYIETGRMNRNVVSKEISISWYKCKLQNLLPDMFFRSCGHKPDKIFEKQFLNYIDSIVPDSFQYVLTNHRLEKVGSRVNDSDFNQIDSIDDLCIGTNGGYITYKTDQMYTVSRDEHYLDRLNNYYTSGILIKKNAQVLGVLMLIGDTMPTSYTLNNLSVKVNAYNAKSLDIIKDDCKTTRNISDFLIYPESYLNSFKDKIDQLEARSHPILIEGTVGSGKTSLAWYIALKHSMPVTLMLDEIQPSLHKQLIEMALSQNETVVLENLYATNDESIGLLTAYTEERLRDKEVSNSFKFKCNQLILTTVNSSVDVEKNAQCWQKLYNRINHRVVNLPNLSEFPSDIQIIAKRFIERTKMKATDVYIEKLIYMAKGWTFRDLSDAVKASMAFIDKHSMTVLDYLPSNEDMHLQTLEEIEKDYVLKIYYLMDQNVTATADILNIGRATLYRKLEKYQNETTT